jgi:hypothetical protein
MFYFACLKIIISQINVEIVWCTYITMFLMYKMGTFK